MTSSDKFELPGDFRGATIFIKSNITPSIPLGDTSSKQKGNAWEVFLGSTAKDLVTYRREVQDALIKRAQVACFLSEDWPGGFDDTVKKCEDRLNMANAYIGVFAHWYGSRPPDATYSITHMEFHWAMKRWSNDPYPPIAIFMPKPGSRADKELTTHAKRLLTDLDIDQQQDHNSRLSKFHQEVTGQWRTVIPFKDRYDLREFVIVASLNWRGNTLMSAAKREVSVVEPKLARTITDEELGSLGRTRHLQIASTILSEVINKKDVVGVLFLVSGNEDASPRVFIEKLKRLNHLSRGRQTKPGRPPLEQYDLKVLVQWIASVLGIKPLNEQVETTDRLAELVYVELHDQHLFFILDEVHRLIGNVTAFQNMFWKPFFSKLKDLCSESPVKYRLVGIAVDYTSQYDHLNEAIVEIDFENEDLNYSKLLCLPKLSDFKKRDVRQWLEDLKIFEGSPEKREEIVEQVMSISPGEVDGTPIRVLDRLRRLDLWPEGNKQ